MPLNNIKILRWDFYSIAIISYCLIFQVLRLPLLPQSPDTYYHLHTAWGFIKAGGYSGWDFWQFAPVGRPHIYPPFFHFILAWLMQLGIKPIILGKLFEAVLPVFFLTVLWTFIRKSFDEALAFFATAVTCSSFYFYTSLFEHIPSTLAIIFGFFAYGFVFRKKILGASLLLTLSLYTHIGASLFLCLSVIFYGLLRYEFRKVACVAVLCAVVLSAPVLYKELAALRYFSYFGFMMPEASVLRIRFIHFILALCGLVLSLKSSDRRLRFFAGFLCAELVFFPYPFRLFSSEGYLPISLASALMFWWIYKKIKPKIRRPELFVITALAAILILSPTLVIDNYAKKKPVSFRLECFNSVFLGVFFSRGQTLWFPQEYAQMDGIIKAQTSENDIIYSTLNPTGVALASISGRATANALFPELQARYKFNPFSFSKIIIFSKIDDGDFINRVIAALRLVKIGENRLFLIYKNPGASQGNIVKKASVSFGAIFIILTLVLLCVLIIKMFVGRMPYKELSRYVKNR